MTIVSIRLHPELEVPLEALSKKLNRSRNSLVNQAIKEFVSKHELVEQRWEETLPALQSIKAGRTVPADKVFEWIRSWDSDNELPRPVPNQKLEN